MRPYQVICFSLALFSALRAIYWTERNEPAGAIVFTIAAAVSLAAALW